MTTVEGRFPIVRRGYDIDAVEQFLGHQEQDSGRALRAATERITELESQLSDAKAKEEAIHLTLIAATKTKEDLLAKARAEVDSAASTASEEAERILADAQYEAYRLVTEAQESAEEATTEARREAERVRAEAHAEAEAHLTAARREAMSIISGVQDETTRLLETREAELEIKAQDFHDEYRELSERVETLRAVSVDLESRLKAIAAGNLADLISSNSLVAEALAMEPITEIPDAPRREEAAKPSTDDEEIDGKTVRGSFYRRRSGGLPRLGEAAMEAHSVVRDMRKAAEENADSHMAAQPA